MNGLTCKLVGKLIPIPVPWGIWEREVSFFSVEMAGVCFFKKLEVHPEFFFSIWRCSMLGHMSSDTL